MEYSTVLFDLDGTLTDPAEGFCSSIIYALEKSGRKAGPIEKYYKYIGPPLLRSFEVFDNATPEEARELLRLYRERFSTVGLFENRVFQGVPEMLKSLKNAGCRIAVATGKPTVYSTQILEHFHLIPYIDYVSGIPLDREPLDKCETIAQALYKLEASDRRKCVMIGDRSHDIIGANMNHIDSIGVLYGFGSYEELDAENPTKIVSDVDELYAYLLS